MQRSLTSAKIADRRRATPWAGWLVLFAGWAPLPQAVGQIDLGVVPWGSNGAVRLVEVGALSDNIQQMAARGNELYFALQGGAIEKFTKRPDGVLEKSPTVFLDVSLQRGAAFGNNPVPAQNGLRGIAFHPDFSGNGKFYTMQTESRGGTPTHALDPAWNLGMGSEVDSVLVEWTFDPRTETLLAQREAYRVQYPAGHHMGQNIAFNPQALTADHPDYGNLYLGFGDSGGILPGADDFSADNVITTVSQNTQTVLGKVLRINPLESEGKPFSIPGDNPFVAHRDPADQTLDEIYALGFRHPQTMSFDLLSGRLIVGEISHNNIEEINVVDSGKNYGWPLREGVYEFLTPFDSTTLTEVPPAERESDPYAYPAAQFDHVNNSRNGAAAAVGGAVYRGTLAPRLAGRYVFGNLSTDQIFFADVDDLLASEGPAEIFQQALADFDGAPIRLGDIVGVGPGGRADMRFGQDSDGELYLISKRNDRIYRFESGPLVEPPSIVGDLNLDGAVTAEDVEAFVAGWKTTFAAPSLESWQQGDMNLDGTSNLADLHLMHSALVAQRGGSAAASETPAPEPATAMLAGLAAVLGRLRAFSGAGRRRMRERVVGATSAERYPRAQRRARGCAVAIALLATCLPTQAAELGQADAGSEQDARMDWWREARFGMFIHWGLYSAAGGEWNGQRGQQIASWLAHEFRIPHDQYAAALMPRFTAARFEPSAWARLARRAGMKYMVATAKHHDGFCLFDSALTDYDAAAAASGRDVLRPMLEAFRREGIRVGVYYSMIDWSHADYPVVGDPLHPLRDAAEYHAQPRELGRYVDYMHGQVRELLTDYGPVDVLWWDFSYGAMSGEAWRAKELIDMSRQLQPSIVMNNRLVALDATYVSRDPQFGGDFQTPEQFVPHNGVQGLDWETCLTINSTWGYKPHDRDFKSSRQLIATLIETASKGGNLLLNVGPRPDGAIPEEIVERLEAVGDWLSAHGEAIYGTSASPFPRRPAWGRVTVGKSRQGVTRLYLHVLDWPTDGRLRVDPLENEIISASVLADRRQAAAAGMPLPLHCDDSGACVTLPDEPIDDDATVIVLEVAGSPVAAPLKILPRADGRIVLAPADADLHGQSIRYPSGNGDVESIGWWSEPQDWVSWRLKLPRPATYRVDVSYGCDASGGSRYALEAGQEVLRAETRATGGWFERVTDSVGQIRLPAGETTVALRIVELRGAAALDLANIELVPVDGANAAEPGPASAEALP